MKTTTAYFVLFLLKIFSLMKLTTVRAAAAFLGPKLLASKHKMRRAINTNLQLAMPELDQAQRAKLIDQRFINMAQTFFEMSHIWFKPVQELRNLVVTTDESAALEQQLKNQEGTLILVPHIGNWEIMASYITQFKPFTAMYRPVKSPILDRYVKAARERTGAKLVPTNTTGIKSMIKALKNNETVLLLPDQVPAQGGGVFAPFFNHQAYTMTLAHRLATRTNARTFMATAYQAEHGFSLSIEAMANEFYDPDPEVSAVALNRAVESAILKQPSQNQWEYKRYKKQPEQQPSLYD